MGYALYHFHVFAIVIITCLSFVVHMKLPRKAIYRNDGFEMLASYKSCSFCDYPSFDRMFVLHNVILRAENTEPESNDVM